jgi:hypothetical protein
MPLIYDLPPDVIRRIASSMDVGDATELSLTNKGIKSTLIDTPIYWRERLREDYDMTAPTPTPKKTYIRRYKVSTIDAHIDEMSQQLIQLNIQGGKNAIDKKLIDIYTYLTHDDVIDYLHDNHELYVDI